MPKLAQKCEPCDVHTVTGSVIYGLCVHLWRPPRAQKRLYLVQHVQPSRERDVSMRCACTYGVHHALSAQGEHGPVVVQFAAAHDFGHPLKHTLFLSQYMYVYM